MRGRVVQPGSKNITAEQKYSQSIGKRLVPLREFIGKDREGNMVGQPVWHDMYQNKSYYAGADFEVPPPDLPSGDPGRQAAYMPKSERYRQNYTKIDWSV